MDDGKSTLIGRLLHDTDSLPLDHLEAVTDEEGVADLAALSDGLRAEREQGITIDVAYRFFSTETRSYILADTPGHERYTRNMFTGASNAHVAILLVDARAGVLRQTRRHARIAKLLGIKHFVATVNKIDLIDFDQAEFTDVEGQLRQTGGAPRRRGHHGDPDRGQARRQRRAPLRPARRGTTAPRCWSTWKASNWPRHRPRRRGCGCRCNGCRGRPPTCAAATPGALRRARSVRRRSGGVAARRHPLDGDRAGHPR